ncbi:MAG: matrixin family metalloprotease [Candidatus Methanoperedens sp.]|nr:matrixin family metalloprotease [Candidatus Methanoperedens sp.]
MKHKKLGTTFKKLFLTLIVVAAMLQIVNAYVYTGYKWPWGSADWRFSTNFPDSYKQSVQNAANTWNNAGSSFRFNYQWYEVTSYVDWVDLGGNGPLGHTNIYKYPFTSSISRAVTEMNSNSAKYWTTTQSPDYPPYDFETAALHEFGHWLSLAHTSDTSTVMYDPYNGPKRSLTQDDKNGIKYIYP